MSHFSGFRNWFANILSASVNIQTNLLVNILVATSLILLLQLDTYHSTLAQSATADVNLIRTFYPSEWSIPQRSGIAYSAQHQQFFLIRQGKAGTTNGSTIAVLTSYGRFVYNLQLDFAIDDALNVAFDDSANRLLLLNRKPAELISITIGANGQLDPATLQRVSVQGFGLRGADSMDVDPQLGLLYILDDAASKITKVSLPQNLAAVSVAGTLDLAAIRPKKFRGIAVNPQDHHLYIMTHSQRKLLELSESGELVNNYDLTALNLTQPRDMVFAHSADLTDAPETFHLYITDSREVAVAVADETTNETTNEISTEVASNRIFLPIVQSSNSTDQSEQTEQQSQLEDPAIRAAAKSQRLGELLEVELRPLGALIQAAAVNVESLQLLRTVDTAAYSPASPDPSGLTYLPFSNSLLMCDGEVEETVVGITHFAGANCWETTLAGIVLRTTNISKVAPSSAKMTNEPTDIAWNPNNGHYYVTDDDALRVYDLNPGPDMLVGTADDSWTFFSTAEVGDVDPEGITYHVATDRIFVSDGINMEIYQYTTSGVFVGQFDVEQYGVTDPEGVEYNPESATLFVLSNVDHQIIVEVTPAGSLLRTFDASAMQGVAPAGLAYAPASDGNSTKHFYIYDRGIDNNADPNIVDGKLYEMTAPSPLPPNTNMPPLVNAGADQSVVLPASSALVGTVTDDGLPNPPSSIAITWTQLSGPGLVTFANEHSAQTSASFTLPGSYTLRLSASDGEYIGTDDVDIAVSGTGTVTAINVAITAGSDDAEENSSNSMSLTSTDLDMMLDSGGTPAITMLAIGLRFNGISIPRGATIVNAYLQFVVDEVHTDLTQFTIQGQAADNATTFTSSKRSITSRAVTAGSVQWTPELWSTVGQSGPGQRTPNLGSLIQEIVNRPGWNSNNSLALIISGSGQRVAKSYEAGASNAPILHVEYSLATATSTSTPTPTPTSTSTFVPPTETSTSTPTATSTSTFIPPTETSTSTSTPTSTGTFVPSTETSTSTSTPTSTSTSTSTPTSTSTSTPTPTSTGTFVPSTATSTSTSTPTSTSTATATATNTPASIITLNFVPSADARVQDNTPTTNYGTSPQLRVRSSGPVYMSYLKFSVTGITGNVQSARIRLYVVDASTVGGSVYTTSDTYLNSTTAWTEKGITWNNAPPIINPPLSTLGNVVLNSWVEFDVTSALQGNGTYNFALTSTSQNAAYFSTKEDTAHPPVLVVNVAP